MCITQLVTYCVFPIYSRVLIVENVEFAEVVQRNADEACGDDDTSVFTAYLLCETIGPLFIFRLVFDESEVFIKTEITKVDRERSEGFWLAVFSVDVP